MCLVYSYIIGISGDKQPWAEPKPSEVRLVTKTDPMKETYYKTVRTQTDLTQWDTQQPSQDKKEDVQNEELSDSDIRHRKSSVVNQKPDDPHNEQYDDYDEKNPFADNYIDESKAQENE